MKPTDKIDRLIKDLKTTASPDLDCRIDTLIAQPQATRPRPLNTWSLIMKSKTLKLSVAAIVFLAVLLSINPFGEQVPLTPIAFGEVVKAMEETAWLKMTSKGFQEEVSGTAEQWIGMREKVHAARWADGKVSFWSVPEGKRYEYLPEEQIIQVTADSETLPFNVSSPAAMLQGMHDMLIGQGAKIVTRATEYEGRKVQLQEISIDVEGMTQSAEFYIEPASKRLIAAHMLGRGPDGNINMEADAVFSYHKTGPTDIYDLGVPRDTPVKVLGEPAVDQAIGRIDAADSWPDPEDLVRRYWQARREKDLETTRLYWPGSEAWDEETFRNESPAEYVFGPSKQINDITLCIPYDVKSYYEENHSYRWKMILTNTGSQKGRYYIRSGN